MFGILPNEITIPKKLGYVKGVMILYTTPLHVTIKKAKSIGEDDNFVYYEYDPLYEYNLSGNIDKYYNCNGTKCINEENYEGHLSKELKIKKELVSKYDFKKYNKKINDRPSGIVNEINTCFLNALTQCLFVIPDFVFNIYMEMTHLDEVPEKIKKNNINIQDEKIKFKYDSYVILIKLFHYLFNSLINESEITSSNKGSNELRKVLFNDISFGEHDSFEVFKDYLMESSIKLGTKLSSTFEYYTHSFIGLEIEGRKYYYMYKGEGHNTAVINVNKPPQEYFSSWEKKEIIRNDFPFRDLIKVYNTYTTSIKEGKFSPIVYILTLLRLLQLFTQKYNDKMKEIKLDQKNLDEYNRIIKSQDIESITDELHKNFLLGLNKIKKDDNMRKKIENYYNYYSSNDTKFFLLLYNNLDIIIKNFKETYFKILAMKQYKIGINFDNIFDKIPRYEMEFKYIRSNYLVLQIDKLIPIEIKQLQLNVPISKEHKMHKYELQSAAIHFGGPSGGHYICCAKYGEQWYRISDIDCMIINTKELYKLLKNARMLIYKKIGN